MFGNKLLSTLITVLLIITASAVQAQESATVQAVATVLSALTVTGSNDLNFGNVTPGTPKAIDKTNVGNAGEWTISGSAGAEVQIDFTLPDSLRSATAAMDILFLSTDASYEDGTGGGQASPAGTLNPGSTNTQNLNAANGSMTIWIGGQVDPAVSQPGGSYSGDIEVTITLTGN